MQIDQSKSYRREATKEQQPSSHSFINSSLQLTNLLCQFMSQKQQFIEESQNNQKKLKLPIVSPVLNQPNNGRISWQKLPKLLLESQVNGTTENVHEVLKHKLLQNEVKEFRKDLYDQALKNRAIIKSLKKYRPSNSSLVVGYRNQQNIQQYVKMQSRRNGMTTSRLKNQGIVGPIKFGASEDSLANIISNLSHLSTARVSLLKSPENKKDTLRKIILGYEHNLRQVRDMLKQEKQMQATLNNDFSKIGEACGLIQESFHLKGMNCFDMKQFKKEIRQLSMRCQVMTRSIRKR